MNNCPVSRGLVQPRVGADWANFGAFQLLYALSGCLVVEALARIRPAAQPNR
jgi:hypothetical protein